MAQSCLFLGRKRCGRKWETVCVLPESQRVAGCGTLRASTASNQRKAPSFWDFTRIANYDDGRQRKLGLVHTGSRTRFFGSRNGAGSPLGTQKLRRRGEEADGFGGHEPDFTSG